MAWRSSGSDNNELVDNLKRFRVISSDDIETGFRNVDRKYFVPREAQELAHRDQPIREGNVHLSAPHIYGSVLEALELTRDTPLSFLNAGSGTGYLTCIAASILGPRSVHYCVEIHKDVILHSKQAIAAWKEDYPPGQMIQHIEFIHGNALELDTASGECALGFDRIYIGAAIDKENLPMFKKLLKPGGILVGPVDDDLLKVVRIEGSLGGIDSEFTVQVLSAVRFAPLVAYPAISTVIPARVWSPSQHKFYPDSFRIACKELLLCSNANLNQPKKPQPPQKSVNAASLLPRAVWVEILSYTHRDWFKSPQNELEVLRRRLMEERANSEKANLARQEAENRCRLAEKERDVYRLLARRWRARLNANSSGNDNESETVEEAAAAMLLSRDPVSMFSIGHMFRRLRARAAPAMAQAREDSSDEDDDEEEEDGEEADQLLDRNASDDRMDEDDEGDDVMNEDTDDDEEDSDDDDALSMGSEPQNAMVGVDRMVSKSLRSSASTARTVSLAEEDF